MKNPHKPRLIIEGDRSRSIFGTPAHFVMLEEQWSREDWNYSSPPPVNESTIPEVYAWLNANVGEEWVDWAVSMDECHGGHPRRAITVAFKNEKMAMWTALRFGKVTPTLIYYP